LAALDYFVHFVRGRDCRLDLLAAKKEEIKLANCHNTRSLETNGVSNQNGQKMRISLLIDLLTKMSETQLVILGVCQVLFVIGWLFYINKNSN